MNKYQQHANKALGSAFIVAPLLLMIGAFTFLSGAGVSSYGVSSWVEGAFMSLAFLLFVPIYLGLARLLGQNAPRLGILCAILGVGIGFGIVPATDRILQVALDQGGYDVPIFSVSHAGFTPILIWTALGLLLNPILLGLGFLRYGGLPRWSAVLILLAPLAFVVGQGGDESIAAWQIRMVYPLATGLWFFALAPIGWRLLNGSADYGLEAGGVQTAV